MRTYPPCWVFKAQDEIPGLTNDEKQNFFTNFDHLFLNQEICDKPRMFVDGTSREDVVQGELADCWFLASCAGIAPHKDLIKKVNKLMNKIYKINQCALQYDLGHCQQHSFNLFRLPGE